MTSQEDDATELQFPKGMDNSGCVRNVEILCNYCNALLQYPHIECQTCLLFGGNHVYICLLCFSRGKEFSFHKNDHDYIVKKNVPIFSEEWKAEEELQLLKAIIECGFGNWNDISKSLSSKTAAECKQHYLDYYISNPYHELSFLLRKNDDFSSKNYHSYAFKPVYGTDDPPRPTESSVMFRELAGYNAARSEFVVEYLNDAENILQDVEIELFNNGADFNLGQELQVALADIYRRQLGERFRKRKIVRDHGLINLTRASIIHNHCRSSLPKFASLIPAINSLISHEEMVYLTESLIYTEELKSQMKDLKECRINGITKQAQVGIYETLKKKREILKKKKFKLVLGNGIGDDAIKEIMKTCSAGTKITNALKRTSVAINLTGEPEFETLSSDEQEIASHLRLLPSRYNRIKNCMIEECRKLNGLRLAHARSLVKIDVNKIRKIYDYLLAEGLIYRPLRSR